MTLRVRLIIGLTISLVILGLTFFSVVILQRHYVESQIDKRLTRLGQITETIITEIEAKESGSQRVLDALWEGYVGVFDNDGVLSTIAAPASDKNLVPASDIYSASVLPSTGPTLSGNAERIRSKTVPLADGRVALVGLATTDGDNSVQQLKSTLLLTIVLVAGLLLLLSWWSYRLGFRPIAQMIRDADAISSGDSDHRLVAPSNGAETAHLAQSLNKLIDSALGSEMKIRQFVADASHELRTPLTTLQGYTSLYLSGGFTSVGETKDAMQRMHAESVRMTRMVNDLLQMNEKFSAGATRYEKIEMTSFIEEIVRDLKAIDRNRIINWNAENELTLQADRERCTQVILALGTNALLHAGDDAAVSLNARSIANGVRFEVSDTGQGIPEEHLPKLFDRLYKVDASRSSHIGGSGLGLAIVAQIVRACGGRFGVESVVGVGSTFWVEFPNS